jgi:Glycosyl hydrolase family 26
VDTARRARVIVVIVTLAVAITAVVAALVRLPRHHNEPARHTLPAAALGAFLGSGRDGVDAVGQFESWLGAPVTVGHTYLPGGTWTDVEGADWVLDPWTAWRAAEPGRMLVMNVPMVVPNEPTLSDDEVSGQLSAGAGGAFDQHFLTLARRLVQRHAPDAVIVLGWEMNGTSYSSRCGPAPEAWKEYWRHIVSAMRSVSGQRFRFDFAPVRGAQAIEWPRCYPGDDVVDIVGMDSYDQQPGQGFDDYIHEPYGLQAQSDFAAAHGKPMSYPEWGLFEHGDNRDYIRAMYNWLTTHNVLYQTISDYCPHGVWRCLDNPAASQAYRQLFGATSSSPVTGSSPVTSSPRPGR